MEEEEKDRAVAEATAEWKRQWVPRFAIQVDVTQDDIPGYKETVEALALQELRGGGADTVEAALRISGGECAGIAFDGMMVSSVADKSHEWRQCVIEEGFFIGSIGDRRLSSAGEIAEALAALGDGEVRATFFRPEPDLLEMGWAMKPPRMTHDAMTGEQLQFLLLQFHSAGKLPAAAIQRSMEATSIEKHPESRLDQKKFTLPIRRVKSWVGYYKSMLKKVESNKGKFTKAVKAARVAVDLDSGDEPAGVEEAGGVEEEGTEEEEAELPPPAPTPRLGLEHVSEGTGGVMVSSDLVGRRIQYRFDGDQGSWWDEVLVAKQTGERQHFDLRGQSQGAEEWKCNGEVGQLELACADGHCALIPGVCAVYDDDGRAVGSAGVRQGRAVGVAKGGTEVRCARGVEESREAEE